MFATTNTLFCKFELKRRQSVSDTFAATPFPLSLCSGQRLREASSADQLVGGTCHTQKAADQQRNKRVHEHEFHEVTSFQHGVLDWQRTASVLSFGKSQPARSVLSPLRTSPARVPDCSPRQTGNEHRFVEVFTNSFVEVLLGGFWVSCAFPTLARVS